MLRHSLALFAVVLLAACGDDVVEDQHQLRGAGTSGQRIPVELIGHFAWANDGGAQAFVVDRFVTIKPDLDC